MRKYAEWTLAILILIVSGAAALLSLPLFPVTDVEFEGDLPETPGMIRTLGAIKGENRFRVRTGGLERKLERLPYVLEADLSMKGSVLTVTTTGRKGLLLIGDDRELFTDGEAICRLAEGDADALRRTYFPLSLEKGRAAYLEEFGAGPEFKRVTALMLELSGGLCYNEKLMSYGSYEAPDGPGFGTLTVVSEPMMKSLIIHEDLSGEYLASLILGMEEKGHEGGFRPQTYEIKDNTLKMRKEG